MDLLGTDKTRIAALAFREKRRRLAAEKALKEAAASPSLTTAQVLPSMEEVRVSPSVVEEEKIIPTEVIVIDEDIAEKIQLISNPSTAEEGIKIAAIDAEVARSDADEQSFDIAGIVVSIPHESGIDATSEAAQIHAPEMGDGISTDLVVSIAPVSTEIPPDPAASIESIFDYPEAASRKKLTYTYSDGSQATFVQKKHWNPALGDYDHSPLNDYIEKHSDPTFALLSPEKPESSNPGQKRKRADEESSSSSSSDDEEEANKKAAIEEALDSLGIDKFPFTEDQILFLVKLMRQLLRKDLTGGWSLSAYRKMIKKYTTITKKLVDEMKETRELIISQNALTAEVCSKRNDSSYQAYKGMETILGEIVESHLTSRVEGLENYRSFLQEECKNLSPKIIKDHEQTGYDRCLLDLTAKGYIPQSILMDGEFLSKVRDKTSFHSKMHAVKKAEHLEQKRERMSSFPRHGQQKTFYGRGQFKDPSPSDVDAAIKLDVMRASASLEASTSVSVAATKSTSKITTPTDGSILGVVPVAELVTDAGGSSSSAKKPKLEKKGGYLWASQK